MAKPDDIQKVAINPEDVPSGLVVEIRAPAFAPSAEDSPDFHAARLLLLLKAAGGRKGRIIGRTKIAKLDFFVRYPSYLAKAISLRNFPATIESGPRPESPMIRYKYGPWDSKYYDIFALLVAKGLIDIYPSEKGDVFQLTDRGRYAVSELEEPEFEEVEERCRIVNEMFGSETGSAIKKFIYDNFPEVVGRPIWKEIEQ